MKEIVDLVDGVIKNRRKSAQVVELLLDQGLLIVRHGNSEVETILGAFKKTFGTTHSSRYDRFAAKRLADSHGAENVVTVIRLVREHQDEQYCPTVGSVRQLEEKWVSIGRFLRGLAKDTDVDI